MKVLVGQETPFMPVYNAQIEHRVSSLLRRHFVPSREALLKKCGKLLDLIPDSRLYFLSAGNRNEECARTWQSSGIPVLENLAHDSPKEEGAQRSMVLSISVAFCYMTITGM